MAKTKFGYGQQTTIFLLLCPVPRPPKTTDLSRYLKALPLTKLKTRLAPGCCTAGHMYRVVYLDPNPFCQPHSQTMPHPHEKNAVLFIKLMLKTLNNFGKQTKQI